MGVKLPRTITKLDLFEEAQKRFQEWVDMYADSSTSAERMYENMSCSCYSGDPAVDFPDDVKAEQDSTIRYQYKDGACFFMIDDIKVEVLDLRNMRKSYNIDKERYADVCVLSVCYRDELSDCITHHIIPYTWLYGSTSEGFDVGAKVHQDFINAARGYIKINHITKEMQEMQEVQ